MTPDLWLRLMKMLRNFEEGTRDETSAKKATAANKPFLVELTNAKCIAANRYKYAWRQVTLNDDNSFSVATNGKTSTGETDEWDFAAINLMEISNTSIRTSAGVNMEGDYPAGWTMQAIGGGSCSGAGCEVAIGSVIVLMHRVGGLNTESVSRHVFTAVNEHDGTCSTTAVAVTDGMATPTVPSGASYGYIYVHTDGNPHFVDSGNTDVTIDTT